MLISTIDNVCKHDSTDLDIRTVSWWKKKIIFITFGVRQKWIIKCLLTLSWN